MSPTEAGERLLRPLAPRIQEIEADLADLMALRDKPSGTVRITISDHAYDTLVWPKLRPVLSDYPDIKVEFSIDNGLRNIVEERFDAGVRLGENLEKDMAAVRIGPDWRLIAVASPGYLARRSAPRTPQDLIHHSCINHRQGRSGGLYSWEFAKDGRDLRVKVEGQLTYSSSIPMIDAAIAGLGIAYVPENLTTAAVESGQLVQVLDEWSPFFSGYHLSYPSRRQMSPALSIVVDALRHRDRPVERSLQAPGGP
ncbi:Transcriptional regulator, LysR family [Devosia sp. DBB001]|nr:Transcriptional regulator, LysR family [Devosia sp. DBB001]